MSIGKGWLRRLLLTGVYALGVFGILASGDGSDGDDFRAFTCGLSVRGIAPVGDGTVWIGVFAKTNTNTEDRGVLLDIDDRVFPGEFLGRPEAREKQKGSVPDFPVPEGHRLDVSLMH